MTYRLILNRRGHLSIQHVTADELYNAIAKAVAHDPNTIITTEPIRRSH